MKKLLLLVLTSLAFTFSADCGVVKIYGPDGNLHGNGMQFWGGYFGTVHLGGNLQPRSGSIYSAFNGSYAGPATHPVFVSIYNQATGLGGVWPSPPDKNRH